MDEILFITSDDQIILGSLSVVGNLLSFEQGLKYCRIMIFWPDTDNVNMIETIMIR